MAKSNHVTLSRLKELIRRQDPPQWGSRYEPAIRATREEAPSRSRFAQTWFDRLARHIHTLSSIESTVLLLAMFNRSLFEIHEQRILATEPRPHPLFGHPFAAEIALPQLRGSIDVCDRLGFIERHPWTEIDPLNGSGRFRVPVHFVGDLLLFLRDDDGPYCVNWTIKDVAEAFDQRFPGSKPAANPKAEITAARSRHAIEELYYADAGIPTKRIVESDLCIPFFENLRGLLLIQHRAAQVEAGIYTEICERLQASIQTGQRPLDILLSVSHRYDLPLALSQACFARALWQRDVRAELMDSAVFIDRPLKPQRRDPLQVYASWFARQST